MRETLSVFWVDLGCRLCNRKRVPLPGSRGWQSSRLIYIVHILSTWWYVLVLSQGLGSWFRVCTEPT